MDPITCAIVAALSKLAEPAVKDTYSALKNAIGRKFGVQAAAAKAVAALEEKPESAGRREVLAEEIAASGAARDTELLRLSEALARAAGATSAGTTVNQQVHGDHNIVAGTGNVTITGGRAGGAS
jgi:hypothetical protein